MKELVIVGAGPHALALLSRILEDEPDEIGDFFIGLGSAPKSIRVSKTKCFRHRDKKKVRDIMKNITVIDPHGTWMGQWAKQFAALKIPHLR